MATAAVVPTVARELPRNSSTVGRRRRKARPLDIHAAGAALPRKSGHFTWNAAAEVLPVAVVYVAYQRIGTTANADLIALFEDSASSGYVAISMTDTQPGFVLLSVPEKDKVSVSSRVYSNRLTGRFTLVDVQTPAGGQLIRLRGSQVLLVD